MSNEKQLKKYFLDIIANYNYCSLNEDFLSKIQATPPVTVLSMGEDGHVASLFPQEEQYWRNAGIGLYKTRNQKIDRISLTTKALLLSSKIYLLVVGNEKNSLLDNGNSLTSSHLSSIYKNTTWIRC